MRSILGHVGVMWFFPVSAVRCAELPHPVRDSTTHEGDGVPI
ncbi:MAG TPA: hypothetical protein VL371_24165 [Gemmataceae bacterium]|nr:hypothetical protein [Gemmataceae bacterium]